MSQSDRRRRSSIQPGTEEAQFFAERLLGLQNLLTCQYPMIPGANGFWMNRREKSRMEVNLKKARTLVEEILNFIQEEPSEPVFKDPPKRVLPDRVASYIRDGDVSLELPNLQERC